MTSTSNIMNISYSDQASDETTDLGVLWQEALIRYYEECGTDLRTLPASRLNITHIKAEQEHQLLIFSEYRHDKSKLDRLRSLIVQNSEIIVGVATHIANAASAAFPPSAAILTAFNYVMNASRAVSEDHDMIVSFFDIMHSFLTRISMLESRIPAEWQFRRFLVNVFSAMMTLSAIARKCRLKGRLSRWAKALIDGSDPKLKGAFDSLHMHLERFESATMLMTLKHTLKSSKKLDLLGQNMKRIQDGVDRALVVSQQTYALGVESKTHARDAALTSHEILAVVERQEKQGTEYIAGLSRAIRTLNKMSYANENLVDAGTRKSIALRAMETLLGYKVDGETDVARFESHYVDGTNNWFRAQDVYNQFELGKVQLLRLSGPAGIGKSTLAYTITKALQQEFIGNSNITVARFFFGEDSSCKSVSQMLRSCALQAAARDGGYREEAVADIHGYERILKPDKTDLKEHHVELWHLLFQTKFTKKSERRLILVLDGVDEIDEKNREYVGWILKAISSSMDMSIQVLFVSNSGSFAPSLYINARTFELAKDLILQDIRAIIVARLRTSSRMKKLSQQTKKKIIKRLSQQADTIQYVDHVLRTLDQLRTSEASVECQNSHTDEEIVTLKKLFAWLANTNEPLHLGCTKQLLYHIDPDNNINVYKEIEDRCNRILCLANISSGGDYEQVYEDSDSTTDDTGDDEIIDSDGDAFEYFFDVVDFQEKGLRGYLRSLGDATDEKLRISASSGHATVLGTIRSILCIDAGDQVDYGERALRWYAAKSWMQHLQAINPPELSEEETACVVESIYDILSNSGGSIRKMESLPRPRALGPPCILGDTDKRIEDTLTCLQTWAVQAANISSRLIPDATAAWMRSLACEPYTVFTIIAEAHVENWLASQDRLSSWVVNNSYSFAHFALYRGRNAPTVQQNQQLTRYLRERADNWGTSTTIFNEEAFMVVSRAFPHIDMTAQAYLSVVATMLHHDLQEPCLGQLDLAIRRAGTDVERMELYMRMAQIRIALAESFRPTLQNQRTGAVGTFVSEGSNIDEDSTIEGGRAPAYDQLTAEALDASNRAAEITSSLSEGLEDSKFKHIAHAIWMFKAKAEIMRGDTSNTVAYCRRAVQVYSADDGVGRFDTLPELAITKSWKELLEVFKVLSGVSWLGSILCLENYTHEIHTAAKATGDIDYVIDQYRYTLPAAEFNGANTSRLMVNWARFYTEAVRTAEAICKAKNILNKAINAKGTAHYAMASFYLSDVLLQEFRVTTQPEKKVEVYGEMQDLMQRVSESMGSDFDLSQSQTMIPLAHMARKMDAFRFQSGLQRTFDGCVAALTDEAGWNDKPSLRMLAKVLAIVKLEREAQIAATCQICVLDIDNFYHERVSQSSNIGGVEQAKNYAGKVGKDDGESQSRDGRLHESIAPALLESGQKREQKNDGGETFATYEPAPASDTADGDLNWDTGTVICSDCDQQIRQWSNATVYLCYYCIEVDLCQNCFDKRAERIAGKPCDDWRVICPQGHRHVQMPVQGWKGITGGIMNIDNMKVPFYDWLMEVKQKKWPDAWERFWNSE